jgi:hypothetical protein
MLEMCALPNEEEGNRKRTLLMLVSHLLDTLTGPKCDHSEFKQERDLSKILFVC